MNDMRAVIAPKSDQLNTDDLLAGPITITITEVTIRPGQEQPVSVFYEGDDGKPYKCCKSMARVMVACWGSDANEYVGKRMTLHADPKVRWGGMEVGGIRITHMSHISKTQTMALTVTKGNKKPFTVQPLVEAAPKPPTEPKKRSMREWLGDLQKDLELAQNAAERDIILEREEVQKAFSSLQGSAQEQLSTMIQAAMERFPEDADLPSIDDVKGILAPAEDDGWPGPTPENVRAEREAKEAAGS